MDRNQPGENQSGEKLTWHQGFYGGIELELRKWKADLTFTREIELTKEPIVADMLVIKKNPDVVIDNPIASRFRTYNLLEYKSPEDILSVDGFYKGLAYVYLYKSQGRTENSIPISEVTYTAFCFHHPRKLFAELERTGLRIEPDGEGLYTVAGYHGLAVQVVVIRELRPGTHLPLRVLRPDADADDVRGFISELDGITEKDDGANASAVYRISYAVNRELYDQVREEMNMDFYVSEEEAARSLFPHYLKRLEQEAAAKAAAEAAAREKRKTITMITRMLRSNEPMEKIMLYADTTRENVVQIANSIGVKLAV